MWRVVFLSDAFGLRRIAPFLIFAVLAGVAAILAATF